MRPANAPASSEMELLHGETFNLVEEVYVVDDSKREIHSEQHLSAITSESLDKALDDILNSLPSVQNPQQFFQDLCKDEELSHSRTDSPCIPSPTPVTSGSTCNELRSPRNLSPVSEESPGDSLTMNLDSAMRTYVSYSTPSLDDVTIVEALPKTVVADAVPECNVIDEVSHCTSAVDEHPQPQHFVVVAIDIGTTYSGYAFCFTRDPDYTIHMMRKWEGKTYTNLILVTYF